MSADSVYVDTLDFLGADRCTVGDTGGGVLGSQIAGTGIGAIGPGYAYSALEAGDMAVDICGRLIYPLPAGLNLQAFEDTSTITSAVGPGNYVVYYQFYRAGVTVGAPQPITYAFGQQSGTLGWAEQSDVMSATGLVTLSGSLAWTDEPDITAMTGTLLGTLVSGPLAWTEANDVMTITGSLPAAGRLAWVEAPDVFVIGAYVDSGFLDPNPDNIYVGAPRSRLYVRPLPKE